MGSSDFSYAAAPVMRVRTGCKANDKLRTLSTFDDNVRNTIADVRCRTSVALFHALG